MKCLICMQSETVSGFTSISFERGEFRLAVNHIPAWICPGCGETYVSEDVTIQLLQNTEKIFAEGVREDVLEY